MGERLFTEDELTAARDKSIQDIDTYFSGRGKSRHDIGGLQQEILAIIEAMRIAANPKTTLPILRQAADAVKYMIERTMGDYRNPKKTDQRNAEMLYTREVLATALGIRDEWRTALNDALRASPDLGRK